MNLYVNKHGTGIFYMTRSVVSVDKIVSSCSIGYRHVYWLQIVEAFLKCSGWILGFAG